MKFIRNPREVMLVRLGAGVYNFGGDSDQQNSTTSRNSSDSYTTNTSTNTTTDTSYNTTDNNTNTVTQDRRTVTDHGISVSADASNVTTTNSGNSTDISTDSHNVSTVSSHTSLTNYTTTDFGAVTAAMGLGATAIKSNQELSMATVDASRYLVGTTADLYQAQLDFATHLSEGANAEARNAIREVSAAAGNALNQVVGVVSKPLDANDPQRLVIIVGLCVVGLVFFSKM